MPVLAPRPRQPDQNGVTIDACSALTLALTGWAAASRRTAPGGAALAAAVLTLGWALTAPASALIVLGCLSAAYPATAWQARLPVVRTAAAVASVLAGAGLAACSALAAALPGWQAGLAVLAVAGAAQFAAAVLANIRPSVSIAVEVTGWLVAVAGSPPSLGAPQHASIALAITGTSCAAVALRPGRRALLWAAIAQGEAALCCWLAWTGVQAPEPYTAPASAALIAFGWHRARRWPETGSWANYGLGLGLTLLPSLVASWQGQSAVRPLLLGLAAATVTLIGARARLRAPLLLGATVLVAEAGHALAPAIRQLVGLLPGWVPVAATGLVLLTVGATYEARLRELGKLRAAIGRMR